MENDIQKAFDDSARLIFGKPIGDIASYAKWLSKRIAKTETVASAFGTKNVEIPNYGFLGKIPRSRVACFEDLETAAGKKIENVDGNEDIQQIVMKVKDLAYMIPDFEEGNNINVSNTIIYLDCINISHSFDIFRTRNSAHSFSTIDSEALFGCYRVLSSKFCIHCYNISNLSACFEMDVAKNCSNSMFCHNVENVHDSMFCFNVKNKKYAIGNVEYARIDYMKIKKSVTEQMSRELEASKELKKDIYKVV